MPEQLGLEQGFGDGRAIDGNKGASPALALVMDHLCGEFLARAALPGDEHRAFAPGKLEQELSQVLGGGTMAQDGLRSIGAFGLLLYPPDRPREPYALGGPADDHAHFVDVHGLAEIVIGPFSHGLVGGLARAEGRNDDDRHVRVETVDLPERLHAAHARHLEVQDHDVRQVLLYPLHGLQAVPGLAAGVPFLRKRLGQNEAHVRLIVYDQDFCRFHGFSFSGPMSKGCDHDALPSSVVRRPSSPVSQPLAGSST
jgi:hypothetical protein